VTITSYDTINGQIVGSRTGASPRVGFSPSVRGDITVAVDETQTRISKSRSLPYGTRIANSGDPRLTGFIAQHGYRYSISLISDYYVRARHYSTIGARWTAVDRIWPYESAYGYVSGNPITRIDPSGRSVQTFGCGSDSTASDCCGKFSALGPGDRAKFADCVNGLVPGSSEPAGKALDFGKQVCQSLSAGVSGPPAPGLCIFCGSKANRPPLPSKCNNVPNPCDSTTYAQNLAAPSKAYIPWPVASDGKPLQGGECSVRPGYQQTGCDETLQKLGCLASVAICSDFDPKRIGWPLPDPCGALLHEIAHAGGVRGTGPAKGGGHNVGGDFAYAVGCCYCRLFGPGPASGACKLLCKGF